MLRAESVECAIYGAFNGHGISWEYNKYPRLLIYRQWRFASMYATCVSDGISISLLISQEGYDFIMEDLLTSGDYWRKGEDPPILMGPRNWVTC